MGYGSEKEENTKKGEWEVNFKSFEKNKIDEEPSRNVITMNGITRIKKDLLHRYLMTYLTLQDAFNFGITCKSLFKDMIDGAAEEGKYRITKICTINIPENIFPHVTFLFTI